jgi:CRISPR-associated protein Cas1
MLTELVYCERLYHFMAVQGVMIHSGDTLEGTGQHARAKARRKGVDRQVETGGDAPPWALPEQLHLVSETLGLVGRLDAVRGEAGALIPVEAKHGHAPEQARPQRWRGHGLTSGAWDGDQIQVMGQILLLEANGYPTAYGEIYYRESHVHVRLERTPGLEAAFHEALARARILQDAPLPDPLLDSPKCMGCSLAPVCLPDETNLLKQRTQEPRRILPARPDGGVLYLSTPGLLLAKDGDSVVIKEKGQVLERVPIKDVIQVAVFGQGIQITSQALHFLLDNQRSIAHLSRGGRILGLTLPLATQNVELRRLQFVKFSLPAMRLAIARDLVEAKIRNQRVLLRRNHPGKPAQEAMADLAKTAQEASSLDTLLGLEGSAARHYFEAFPGMLQLIWQAHMKGRSRRPPRDAVNACLSFAYALLARDAAVVLSQVGLDPMFGAYHAMKPGRPALALDLMEPFRPLIADSAVLRALNTGMLEPPDVLVTPGGAALTDAARPRLIEAYEQRMSELITHPAFGYRISYRRVLELEARLLAQWLEGGLSAWKPLVTR